MNDQKDYDLYVLSEIAYKNKHSLEDDETIFPSNWYSSKNYKLKIEIIAEAIAKGILIKETDAYKHALINGMFN